MTGSKMDNTGKNLATLWGVFVALILVFLGYAIFVPDPFEPLWVAITYGVIVLGVLVGIIINHLKSRTGSFGVLSAVSVILVFGIVVFINFLANKNTKSIDLTSNKVHTLSDQTKKLVESLSDEVTATFYARTPAPENFRDLLKKYETINNKFVVKFVDPFTQLAQTKEAGISRPNTVVLAYGKKTEKIENPDEEKLTNTLIKMTRTKENIICAIVGHGEKDFNSAEEEGYRDLKKDLENQAYKIQELSVMKEGKIPENCSSIAILGPDKDFLDDEVKILADYLKKGGRALVSADLNLKETNRNKEIYDILKDFGVTVENKVVIDPFAQLRGAQVVLPIIDDFSKDHPIVGSFTRNQPAVLPFSRPITIAKTPPKGLTVNWVARSNAKSWGESDLAGLAKGKVNPKGDVMGPQNTVVAIEGKMDGVETKQKTRIVVFGSTAFASNRFRNTGSNSDLFLNSANWLMNDEELISIRSKGDNKFDFSRYNARAVQLSTILGLPAIFAFLGWFVWFRRRKL